jgi:hypothetical protein
MTTDPHNDDTELSTNATPAHRQSATQRRAVVD